MNLGLSLHTCSPGLAHTCYHLAAATRVQGLIIHYLGLLALNSRKWYSVFQLAYNYQDTFKYKNGHVSFKDINPEMKRSGNQPHKVKFNACHFILYCAAAHYLLLVLVLNMLETILLIIWTETLVFNKHKLNCITLAKVTKKKYSYGNHAFQFQGQNSSQRSRICLFCSVFSLNVTSSQ